MNDSDMPVIALGRSESGATAVEYAVIAALIGMGIVGSLTTTKGSLSAILNVASQNMASATATTAAPKSLSQAATQRAAYWAAKGLISKTNSGKDTVYTYGDGSTVTYTADASTDFQDHIIALDSQTHRRETYYRLPNGNPFIATVIQYAPDNSRIVVSYLTNSGTNNWSNTTPLTQQTNTFDGNGNYTGQSVGSPTSQYQGYIATAQSDIDAFAN
jgi:Flp pilus assembly pilin Flp